MFIFNITALNILLASSSNVFLNLEEFLHKERDQKQSPRLFYEIANKIKSAFTQLSVKTIQ